MAITTIDEDGTLKEPRAKEPALTLAAMMDNSVWATSLLTYADEATITTLAELANEASMAS